MIITSSMIHTLLGRDYALCIPGDAQPSAGIERAEILASADVVCGAMYIADDPKRLLEVQAPQGCSFLLLNMDCVSLPDRFAAADVAFIRGDGLSGTALLHQVYSAIIRLQRWDCDLKEACLRSDDFSKLFEVVRTIYPEAILLVDGNLAALAQSDDVPREAKEPLEIMSELIYDEDYYRLSKVRDPFLFYINDQMPLLCRNIFLEDRYVARVISQYGVKGTDRGLFDLLFHFSEYVKLLFERNELKLLYKHQMACVHSILREYIISRRDIDEAYANQALKLYGWELHHCYKTVVIRFSNERKYAEAANIICRKLEKEWPQSCAIAEGSHIYWVVNISRSSGSRPDLFQSIACMIRDFDCKAGASQELESFMQIESGVAQCEAALKYGEKKKLHKWCYRFEDFILDYILDRACQEILPRCLCHPQLRKLMEYDRINKTEYAKTLLYYVRAKYNLNTAAQELFIHRSTMLRRMEKINRMTNINFDDDDAFTLLLLSFRLMDTENAV